MATRKRSTVHRAAQTTTVAVGNPQQPTAIIGDDAGASDAVVLTNSRPDAAGAGDNQIKLTPGPTDTAGASDSLSSVTGSATPTDDGGASDVLKLEVQETAQARSGTPDSDSWGDAWVDRTVGQTGVNHGNETTMTVSAVTALTEQDGYLEFNGTRLSATLVDDGAQSTLTFKVQWATVALSPNATLQVDFQTSAGRPFTESTVNASNRARFNSAAPFSQRTFVAAQDGTLRTHVVTFTAAELNAILGNWLLVQFTVPDLTLGTQLVQARESANKASIDFFVKRQ